MKKILIIGTYFLCFFSLALNAQTRADSVKKAVRKDIRKFELSKGNFKIFRKGGISEKSDLFKPTQAQASTPQFLTDSAYVHAYRTAAYGKTTRRYTTGHYVLIVGIGVVLTPVVLAILLNNTLPK